MLPVLFFLAVAMLYPFAVGPDAPVLARTGGGVIWVAALLAACFSLPGGVLAAISQERPVPVYFIGVGEKLSEVYFGPMVGGGIEIWFAYVLALGFLLIRPQGLFGEKIIDRV